MDSPGQKERMRILEMIESETITPEEGLQLLEALEKGSPSIDASAAIRELDPPSQAESPGGGPSPALDLEPDTEIEVLEAADSPYGGLPPELANRKGWWRVIFWAGALTTLAGGLLMYAALIARGTGFWFFCASLPFLLGAALLAFGWYSRKAAWLHLRISQRSGEWPENIALSFPLPIRPMAWFLKTFGRWIPDLAQSGIDEVILALGESATPENPLYIEVEDEEDGERVEVFIG